MAPEDGLRREDGPSRSVFDPGELASPRGKGRGRRSSLFEPTGVHLKVPQPGARRSPQQPSTHLDTTWPGHTGPLGHRADARRRGEFGPGSPHVEPSWSEQMLDLLYRWRSGVGIGVATVMTVAVVAVFLSRTGNTEEPFLEASSPLETVPTEPTDLTDFTAAAPADPGTSELVDSEIGSTTTTTPTSTSAVTAVSPVEPTTTTTVAADPAPVEEETTTTTSSVPDDSTTTVESTTTSSVDGGSTPPDPNDTTTTSTPDPEPARVVLVEAESGTLLGSAKARDDHEGFTGSGFVGDLLATGSGVDLSIEAPSSGLVPVTIRYAAGNGGPEGTRTITVLVNGKTTIAAEMAVTPSWNDWDIVTGQIELQQGANQITLMVADGDTGWVNIDSIQLN
ncbi:MAG: CBM35 domain-containing protein [Actinomycetota bacterium]